MRLNFEDPPMMIGATPLTPRQIVHELDQYIVGQQDAKKAVAIALRNRWRRRQLSPELRDEVAPKNIIMIGPTGVGKTEIARRLARLAHAPFIKVEATKFTEVGYVGRDVEAIIRDLTHVAVGMEKKRRMDEVREEAQAAAEERMLDLLFPPFSLGDKQRIGDGSHTRERLREKLKAGALHVRPVEIETEETAVPLAAMMGPQGMEELSPGISDMLGQILPKRKRKRTVSVEDGLKILAEEEAHKRIDEDAAVRAAVDRVENEGIVFLDELDKIAGDRSTVGPDVSREGVQRDLLPIVEGTTVSTKHGPVRTDHILFIAAGAFHSTKPSDLMPELQGRFPIRVEVLSLTEEDFRKILTQPRNALTRQYEALFTTEGIRVIFEESGILEISKIAFEVNERAENIGARRLYTIMEKLLEDVSFAAPETQGAEILVDREYVRKQLSSIVKDEDLSRFIL
jgi:ATP-dependent HslUV protease ATP-binding subunit HslU